MIDRDLLRRTMAYKGKNNMQMAEAIGRSRYYFQAKLNDSKFTLVEAKIIRDELELTAEETMKIFFK